MCGFSLIISKDNDKNELSKIKSMNEIISHRGPDGDGFYFYNNVAIGHRRLSIIDLSNLGLQPMSYGDDLTLSYNGEIYNYIELRQDLIKRGYKFKSQTDSEVILAAYSEWGEECVKRFNGMWGFVLLDKKENKIFCSRDRFGVKPFYFYSDSKKFVAGSEIKQILPMMSSTVVNESVMEHFLMTSIVDYSEETFFKDVMKLNPSENLIYDLKTNTFEIKRYFDIEKKDFSQRTKEEILSGYDDILYDAIKLRLRSDVKVGTCLSGGLDSSSIAATASKLYASNEKFNAIHGKAIEKHNDESKYANRVSESSNINLHITEPSENDFINAIEDVVRTQEEPFGGTSIFMQYFVMKKAKEKGCIVMLDGQGGDETLLGYDKYYSPHLKDILHKKGFINFVTNLKQSLRNNSNLSYMNLIKFHFGLNMPKLRFLYTYLTRNLSINKSIFNKGYKNVDFTKLTELSNSTNDIFKLQRHEIYSTNLPMLLKFEDKNSMRFSIETRLPFIDYRHINYALSMDSELKINNGWSKYALRNYAEKHLPGDVVWRKDKFGFNAPEKTWLHSNSKDFIDRVKESKMVENFINKKKFIKHFDQIDVRTAWSVSNIALWERIYKVN